MTLLGGPPRVRDNKLRGWLLESQAESSQQHSGPGAEPTSTEKHRPWWRVMCLTGVDYFSTLGYQPGIAAIAAGSVAPVATLVLVLLTLLGALPVYRKVAHESPHGEGSIAMLERLLSWWQGKLLVLVLLGFAATDFLITMTLSTADATAHAIENPYVPSFLHGHQVLVTMLLLALLAAVFLKGFTEAVGIAVVLVGIYLALNLVVVLDGLAAVVAHPHLLGDWHRLLVNEHPNPFLLLATALIVFPKLALGLSGFETGVAVMPLVQGDEDDDPKQPRGRIRDTRKLLTTAAVIMSCFLLTSSLVTTVLIPPAELEGAASSRALAFLAHERLGNVFGTAYDVSTITILWFAGASAMAGLLNLVPRYLPRYGMAPAWARAVRPLVLVFTLLGFLVTFVFQADVERQGGAYATGVLVLITSAAVAVTLSSRRAGNAKATIAFGLVSAVFVYTTVANMVERPDGLIIGSIFIVAILVVSILSRFLRSFELRVTGVHLDETAERLVRETASNGALRLVANERDPIDSDDEYEAKERQERAELHIPRNDPVLFVEVDIPDSSEFETELEVRGEIHHGHPVLRLTSSSVPNAIAALLLHLRDSTGARPHVYFEWTEGNPLVHLLRFFFLGVGEVAPVTREVLREAEPDPDRRPVVHVA